MSTETPLAVRLLNAFEHYYRENAALRLILSDRHIPGWERELQRSMADEKMRQAVPDQFSAVRSALREEGAQEEALQQLLKVFQPAKT